MVVPYAINWTIATNTHTSYRRSSSNPLNSFNTNNADDTFSDRLPLIQIMYGKLNSAYMAC